MPTLSLIRHAEPAVKGVFLGQLDPPLSSVGLHHAAESLRHLQVAIVYCSPLQRARQTAACLPASQTTELTDLREIDYGLWTGKAWSAIQTEWSEVAERKATDWLGVSPPGGEAWSAFVARIQRAWRVIRSGPSPAAVVAHQAVNAALAQIITGQNPLAFTQLYGEVICVEYD